MNHVGIIFLNVGIKNVATGWRRPELAPHAYLITTLVVWRIVMPRPDFVLTHHFATAASISMPSPLATPSPYAGSAL